MASVDPYSPCPCGSGKKFKWCCQKVEPYAEKARRLLEGGQVEASLAALNEGLRKAPGNPWLSVRKALTLVRQGRTREAVPLLRTVAAAQPGHLGAQALLVRAVLETEGPRVGAGQLQLALAGCPPEQRGALASTVQLVGIILNDVDYIPGALKHLGLALKLSGEGAAESPLGANIRAIEGNPLHSPWLRNPYELAPPPAGLTGPARERFERALRRAEDGLWTPAAEDFDALACERIAEAERDLGLCRLWLVDSPGAVEALRRFIGRAGATTEAVDLESLCQLISEPAEADLVEHVELSWTLRDREGLLAALRASDRANSEGSGPIDPDDPTSPTIEVFQILDRPKPRGELPPDVANLPRVLARAEVGPEAALDTIADGRMDGLIAWFTATAGLALPPSHPRTKTLEKLTRDEVALRSELWFPPDLAPDRAAAYQRQEIGRIIMQVWPETPLPYFDGRTPRQMAEAGDAQIPLRAALCRFETNSALQGDAIDFAALRAGLRVEPEPEIDPATADINRLHIARLHRVPADRLDDEKLVALYQRAQRYGLPLAVQRAARALVERPVLLDRPEIGRVGPYADLSNYALLQNDRAGAYGWLERGRRADPAGRAANTVRWDLLEVRLRSQTEALESWVPHLAVALDRHQENRAAAPLVLSHLIDMGLVRMVAHPERPDDILLDSRPLQALLAEYGPRITTASGTLGISATRGGIWTPDAAAGATTPGGIWTPGGGTPAAPGGEKPKLFIPGR